MHTRLKGLPSSDGEFFAVSGVEVMDNAQVPRFLWAGGAFQGIRCVLIKYLLWTWCLYSYLASCGGGGVLQLADFCIKNKEKISCFSSLCPNLIISSQVTMLGAGWTAATLLRGASG